MSRRAALAAGGLALALGLLYAIDPAQVPWTICPVRAVSGLACPGCGSLRGLHHLLHGEYRAALGHNLLLVLTLPLLAWLGGCWVGGRRARVPNALVLPLLLVAVAYGVARNG